VQSCKTWSVKPNSQVMHCLMRVEEQVKRGRTCEVEYDFSMSHIGDRGVVCVLHALAHDPYCKAISFMGCGLRRASALPISVFIELHPAVCHLNLSQNNLSYDTGECLLHGLRKRAERVLRASQVPIGGQLRPQSPSEKPTSARRSSQASAHAHMALSEVTVNLGGTALAWDRTGTPMVGPPAGSLWSTQGSSRAPFRHERLRSKLDETQGVVYSRSRTPSPDTPSATRARRRSSTGQSLMKGWHKIAGNTAVKTPASPTEKEKPRPLAPTRTSKYVTGTQCF